MIFSIFCSFSLSTHHHQHQHLYLNHLIQLLTISFYFISFWIPFHFTRSIYLEVYISADFVDSRSIPFYWIQWLLILSIVWLVFLPSMTFVFWLFFEKNKKIERSKDRLCDQNYSHTSSIVLITVINCRYI